MRRRVFELRNAVLRQFAATLAVTSLVLLAGLGAASAQSGTPTPDQGKQPAAQATDAAKATLALSKPISNGLTYNFTFRFEKAGEATVVVPISAGEAPRRDPVQDTGNAGGH